MLLHNLTNVLQFTAKHFSPIDTNYINNITIWEYDDYQIKILYLTCHMNPQAKRLQLLTKYTVHTYEEKCHQPTYQAGWGNSVYQPLAYRRWCKKYFTDIWKYPLPQAKKQGNPLHQNRQRILLPKCLFWQDTAPTSSEQFQGAIRGWQPLTPQKGITFRSLLPLFRLFFSESAPYFIIRRKSCFLVPLQGWWNCIS